MIVYPVYFLNKICPHCGSKLSYINKFGKISKELIYPIDNFVCVNCKRRFFIKWVKDEQNNMIPTTCAKVTINNFENMVSEYVIKNKRKLG